MTFISIQNVGGWLVDRLLMSGFVDAMLCVAIGRRIFRAKIVDNVYIKYSTRFTIWKAVELICSLKMDDISLYFQWWWWLKLWFLIANVAWNPVRIRRAFCLLVLNFHTTGFWNKETHPLVGFCETPLLIIPNQQLSNNYEMNTKNAWLIGEWIEWMFSVMNIGKSFTYLNDGDIGSRSKCQLTFIWENVPIEFLFPNLSKCFQQLTWFHKLTQWRLLWNAWTWFATDGREVADDVISCQHVKTDGRGHYLGKFRKLLVQVVSKTIHLQKSFCYNKWRRR